MTSNLYPVGRGYPIALDKKGEHSLSACTPVYTSSFVARSATLVNIEKRIIHRTNLIVGYGLLQVIEGPEHIPVVLNVVGKPL